MSDKARLDFALHLRFVHLSPLIVLGHGLTKGASSIPSKYQTVVLRNNEKKGFGSCTGRFDVTKRVSNCVWLLHFFQGKDCTASSDYHVYTVTNVLPYQKRVSEIKQYEDRPQRYFVILVRLFMGLNLCVKVMHISITKECVLVTAHFIYCCVSSLHSVKVFVSVNISSIWPRYCCCNWNLFYLCINTTLLPSMMYSPHRLGCDHTIKISLIFRSIEVKYEIHVWVKDSFVHRSIFNWQGKLSS